GTPYTPGGKIIDRWRAFQANELCHVALEALLNAMAMRLVHQIDGVEPSKLIGGLVTSAIPAKERKLPWSEWAVAVSENSDSEDALSQEVLDGLKRYKARAEDPKLLLAATELLAVLWRRWS